jgi:hypothetical protein
MSRKLSFQQHTIVTNLQNLLTVHLFGLFEHASIVLNSISSPDSAKLERIGRKYAVLCYTSFFNNASTSKYKDILDTLDFLPLHMRGRHLDTVFS